MKVQLQEKCDQFKPLNLIIEIDCFDDFQALVCLFSNHSKQYSETTMCRAEDIRRQVLKTLNV